MHQLITKKDFSVSDRLREIGQKKATDEISF